MPKQGAGDSRQRRNIRRYLDNESTMICKRRGLMKIPGLEEVENGGEAGKAKIADEYGGAETSMAFFLVDGGTALPIE